MTAQEFVQYMPADALAETIAHITETAEPIGSAGSAVAVAWCQLTALVGDRRAMYMVFGNNDPSPEHDALVELMT